MKTTFLLPNYWKWIGWPLYVISSYVIISAIFFEVEYLNDFFEAKVFGLYSNHWKGGVSVFSIIENNIIDEIVTIINLLSGLTLISYKSNFEDELIKKIRLETFQWATIINVLFVVFVTMFIYGETFINFIYSFIFSFIFFNVIRLHYQLYQFQKISDNDE
jgi:hypothetical protein